MPAAPVFASICDRAAQTAARQTGVPVSVLKTVTRVETGRKSGNRILPWPWAINLAGKSFWFDTADEALAFAFRQFKSGARNFDVGCFQLNYRWHSEAFSSIEDMFDPEANALYAARFLAELHSEFGDWEAAAGAYHSRTKVHSDRYKARYRTIFAGLEGGNAGAPENRRRMPLEPGGLISGGTDGHRTPGSLVALSTRANAAFLTLD